MRESSLTGDDWRPAAPWPRPRRPRRRTAPSSTSAPARSATTTGVGPRAHPRAVPRHVARPRAGGDGNRLDGHHGQRPQRRRAARHRRVPHRQVVRQRAHAPRPRRARCAAGQRGRRSTPAPDPAWNGWGNGTSNNRVPDGRQAGLTAADVPKLKLKWAFAFPGDLQSYAQATDRRRAPVRRQLGRQGLLAQRRHRLHPLVLRRRRRACARRSASGGSDGHRTARTRVLRRRAAPTSTPLDAATGAPAVEDRRGRLPRRRASAARRRSTTAGIYVGVASGEEASGAVPTYECCKFRGSVVALDAATGKQSLEDLH